MSNCICGNDDCVLCEAVLKADLPKREICGIQGLINKETYKQGEVLFREGDPCHYFFILTMGHAKLVMSLNDGREQIIGLGVPGRLLGFQHLDGQKYTYSAIATAPVSVCKVRYKHMLKVLEQHPRTAIRVINVLNSELRQTQYMMSVMGRKTVSEKLATFILSLMPRNKSNQNVVDLPLSRLEIAEILGKKEILDRLNQAIKIIN